MDLDVDPSGPHVHRARRGRRSRPPQGGRRLRAALAALVALIFARTFGLLPSWRQAWSLSLPHRQQSYALLEGRLWLSRCPSRQQEDLVWLGDQAHQVWGLGVPLWRLPLEALTRLSSLGAFPDRYALVLFIALVTMALFATTRRTAALLLVFHAPLYALFHTRFAVYEETACYAYFAAIGLLATLSWALERDDLRRSYVLGLLGGLATLVRPTLLFYALAAALAKLATSRLRGREALILGLGLAFGLTPLLVTNALRFGSPLEFGHGLNVSVDAFNNYALKFGAPYERAGLWEAARELFDALFGSPTLNGRRFYATEVFAGQASLPRFRELYFRTYDGAWAVLGLIGAVAGLRAPSRAHRAMALFGAIGFAGTAALYLWSPSLTSRYLLDFGPALATLGVIPLLCFGTSLGRFAAIAALLSAFLGLELSRTEHAHDKPQVTTSSAVDWLARGEPRPCMTKTRLEGGDGPVGDGVGWYRQTRRVEAAVTLFVRDASCLHVVSSGDLSAFRAVIDGDEMERIDGVGELWFRRRSPAKQRLSVAFLATMAPERAQPKTFVEGVQLIDDTCPPEGSR